MRIFSYILATLVTIFVLNIALSFSLPSYRNTLVNTRTSIFPVTKKTLDIPMVDEKISESARLVESLDRIDKHIESLNEAKKTEIETINTESTSGTVISLIDTLPKEPEILLSGIFLSKIMPEVMVKKIDNS
ncbi:hypothetical protein GW830_04800 [bacterium]|nr:hypothetical protein [bacterium]